MAKVRYVKKKPSVQADGKPIFRKDRPLVGIIGGCGPIATLNIEREIIEATKRLTFPLGDQDYPDLVIYQYNQFSDRNDAICFDGESPYELYVESANKLISMGARILLFACNTAHVYIGPLKKELKKPIIDIIQEVVEYAVNRFSGILKIGLLSTDATNKEGLYRKAFASYKISIIAPDASIRKQVMHAIYLIKAGITVDSGRYVDRAYLSNDWMKRISKIKNHPYKKILARKNIPNPCDLINSAVRHLLDKGCNHIILGCTELPVIIEKIENKINGSNIVLINPNKIAAEAVVKIFMNNQVKTKQ